MKGNPGVSSVAELPDQDVVIPEENSPAPRPRLRRDVVFADMGNGAFLRHADDGMVLRGSTIYRWIASLAPHLDGTHTLDEICEGLPPERASMVRNIVTALLDRGFARHLPPAAPSALSEEELAAFAPQIRFIEHYVDDAASRFETYRTTRLLVVGAGPVSAALVRTVASNGMQAVDVVTDRTDLAVPARCIGMPDDLGEYDLVIALGDDLGIRGIDELVKRATAASVPALPCLTAAGRAFVGPLVRPDSGPGLRTLVERLAGNLDPVDAADLWRAFSTGEPVNARAVTGELAGMLGGLLGFEVFRHRTGCLPTETEEAVIIQNLETLDVTREVLLPHPADRRGPQLADAREWAVDDLLREADDAQAPDTERETDDVHAATEKTLDLIRRHVGIFREMVDLAIDQSPLKIGLVEIGGLRTAPRQPLNRTTVAGFDIFTPLQARSRALLNGCADYVATWGLEAAYENLTLSSGPRVDLLLDPAAELPDEAALPAVSLLTGADRAVPAAAVFPLSAANVSGRYELSRAGEGAGLSLAEAVREAVLSAVTYRVLRDAITGARAVRRLDLGEPAPGTVLRFLLDSARNLGIETEVLDLSDGPGATVLALDRNPEPGADHPQWAAASGTTPLEAVQSALRELVGRRQLQAEELEADARPVPVPDLDPRVLTLADGTTAVEDVTEAPLRDVLARAADGGDALLVETTTADIAELGLATVRVLLSR